MDSSFGDFRCRCCRTILFSTKDLADDHEESSIQVPTAAAGPTVTVTHSQAVNVSCSSWYLKGEVAINWIMEAVEKSHWTISKLYCPKCNGRIGAFNFLQGIKCNCGKFVIPAVWVHKSRVDHSVNHTMPYVSQPKLHVPPSQGITCRACRPRVGVELQKDLSDTCTLTRTRELDVAFSCFFETKNTTENDFKAAVSAEGYQCKSESCICACQSSISDTAFVKCCLTNIKASIQQFIDESGGFSPRESKGSAQGSSQSMETQAVGPGTVCTCVLNATPTGNTGAFDSFEQESDLAINEHFTKKSRRSKKPKTRRGRNRGSVDCICDHMENKDEQVGETLTHNQSDCEVQDHYMCPICLDLLYEPCQCQCDHVFCDPCLRQLNYRSQLQNVKCPMCREVIKKSQPATELRNEIKKMCPKLYRSRHRTERGSEYRKWPLPSSQKPVRLSRPITRETVELLIIGIQILLALLLLAFVFLFIKK